MWSTSINFSCVVSVVCLQRGFDYKNKVFKAFKVTPFAINSSEEPDGKKAKQDEEEEDYSLANITEGTITSVRFWGGGRHYCSRDNNWISAVSAEKKTHYIF